MTSSFSLSFVPSRSAVSSGANLSALVTSSTPGLSSRSGAVDGLSPALTSLPPSGSLATVAASPSPSSVIGITSPVIPVTGSSNPLPTGSMPSASASVVSTGTLTASSPNRPEHNAPGVPPSFTHASEAVSSSSASGPGDVLPAPVTSAPSQTTFTHNTPSPSLPSPVSESRPVLNDPLPQTPHPSTPSTISSVTMSSGTRSNTGNADVPPPKSSPAPDKKPTIPDSSSVGPSITPTHAPSSASPSPTVSHSSSPVSRQTSPIVPATSRDTPSKPTPPSQSESPLAPPAQHSSSPDSVPHSPSSLSSPSSPSSPSPPSPPSRTSVQQSQPVVSSHPSSPSSRPDKEEPVDSRPTEFVPAPSIGTTRAPIESHTPQESGTDAPVEPVLSSIISTPPSVPSHASSADLSGISPVNHLQDNSRLAVTTSTITDRPETTLSSPVFISTTDSAGHLSLSVPPIFSSVGVSTEPDGSLVTVTHVVANPTGIWGVSDNTSASKKGFFSNTGAVAGVFLVVGIVVAAIAASICIVVRRNRRRRTIRHSISRPLPYPENPFEDPRDSPSPTQMRYASDSSHRNLVGTGLGAATAAAATAAPQSPPRTRNLLDDEMDADVPPAPLPPSLTYQQSQTYARGRQPGPRVNQRLPSETMGLAGIGTGRRSLVGSPVYEGPFSDYHALRPTHHQRPNMSGSSTGTAIAMEQIRTGFEGRNVLKPPPPLMEVPSAESSPSIYPVSLPPAPTPTPGDDGHGDDDTDLDDLPSLPSIPVPVATPVNEVQQPTPTAASARPRPQPPVIPPRSPLRHSNYTPEQTKLQLLVRTQFSSPQLQSGPVQHQSYEPLTPPASVSSDSHSPSTSEKGLQPHPFLDYAQEVKTDANVQAPALVSFPSSSTTTTTTTTESASSVPLSPASTTTSPSGRLKDTFYTRRKDVEIRPATTVEWKN